jgi:hypothetical protein
VFGFIYFLFLPVARIAQYWGQILTKQLQKRVVVPAIASDVLKALQSEEFNLKKSLATNARQSDFSVTVKEGTLITSLKRTFEPELPAVAQNLLGDQVVVIERFTYPAQADQSLIEIEIAKAPLEINGYLKLIENDSKTEILVSLTMTANLPFFGEKIENFAQEIWSEISSKEFDFMIDWFTPRI